MGRFILKMDFLLLSSGTESDLDKRSEVGSFFVSFEALSICKMRPAPMKSRVCLSIIYADLNSILQLQERELVHLQRLPPLSWILLP